MPLDSGSNHRDAARGLPPVQPPSARFIVQLFLIPGLIIGVAVMILLGASFFVRSAQSPDNYLRELDSPNPEIRWRGAHDLAQVLKRPESTALASDPVFALELTDRLRRAVEDLEAAEDKITVEIERLEAEYKLRGQTMPQEEKDAIWRKLRSNRDFLKFLIPCLGEFTVPVGAPLLCELAVKDTGNDPKSVTLRRQSAILALANLGNQYKVRFLGQGAGPNDKVLTKEQKDAVRTALEAEKEAYAPRGPLAVQTPGFLDGKNTLDVDVALERCARADNPFLRELAALALNFWDGPRVEPTLLRLAKDRGEGTRIEITDD